MKRRDFMKGIVAGAGVLALPGGLNIAMAEGMEKPDKFLIVLQAFGGWDVLSICDPKGDNISYSDTRGPMTRYKSSDIRQAGNLKYAPELPGTNSSDYLDTFYQKYYDRLLVLNGVNLRTNGHATGSQYFSSGVGSPVFPVLCALHSAPFKSQLLLPFFAAGGHRYTGGLVPPGTINVDSLSYLKNENYSLPNDVYSLVENNRTQTLEDLSYAAPTVADEKIIAEFKAAHSSGSELEVLYNNLPTSFNTNRHRRNCQIAAACFASGVSASASMSIGFFDSHGNNDASQANQVSNLFSIVDFLYQELERQGIIEQTTIMIGSDLARTPWFNARNGRDHWTTGSYMFLGGGVRGNRTIGATNNQLRPIPINPTTLELDSSSKGIVLTPGHIHTAVRHHIGIKESDNRKFELGYGLVDLFS